MGVEIMGAKRITLIDIKKQNKLVRIKEEYKKIKNNGKPKTMDDIVIRLEKIEELLEL
jgi:hypothetical protein